MRFVKMHGIGNDYVYLDAYGDPSLESRPDLADLARRVSDRHTGIGSDGLILVCRPRELEVASLKSEVGAHARMRMFNADGSESEMCGNGVRCVAKFVHDRLGVRANPLLIQTGRGVLSISYDAAGGRLSTATVDMGEPILELAKIPVDESKLSRKAGPNAWTLDIGERPCTASFVSMGNPHAVIFNDGGRPLTPEQVRDLDLPRLGPPIEHDPAFPRRINAHWAAVHSRREATMRTWERGAGPTMACGTGACAVAVAGVLTGRFDRDVLLHLPGGDLRIRWDEKSNHVFKSGPATEVFEGEWVE